MDGYCGPVAKLRLFASAREAAGTAHDRLPGDTVREVLDAAVAKYGSDFEGVLTFCTVWCNGEGAQPDDPLSDADEVAVLPPVSGGWIGVFGTGGTGR